MFHEKCVMAAFAESMTQQGLVDMDECNMDSCGRHGDDNSDHGDVRGREKTKQVVVVEASVRERLFLLHNRTDLRCRIAL